MVEKGGRWVIETDGRDGWLRQTLGTSDRDW